jgi:flavin-dependent dehydrogenase
MKIAIAGAGIAGGYLARLLSQKGFFPVVYDGMDHDTRCGYRSCGWGAPEGIAPYLAAVGLDLQEYLIEPMTSMNFDGLVATTPLWTIDKPGLIRDFTRDLALTPKNLDTEEAEGYDLVVDATGIARALLPPCRSDLTLPTVQHRVNVEPFDGRRLEPGVYGNHIPGLGYLWIFPLGKNQFHIGIGGIGLVGHDRLMDRFYQDSAGRFSFTRLCGCRGVVRVASPYYSMPFYSRNTRKDGTSRLTVGVGESIGTVAPFTGEGIVYSLECARMFADTWQDPEAYTRSVLSQFAWMKKERETLDYLLAQGKNGGPRMRDRWRFFQNAHRSGIGLPMLEAFKRMGSLSRWVEGTEE